MAQTQMMTVQARYSPMGDVLHRHERGVSKSKKMALTGSGRAWREDEETYLLQTRQEKMPYKHIAAHLNKTELACRLHYHQLSHGNARRKRTTSCSSPSPDPTVYAASLAPSPTPASASRPLSPAQALGGSGYMLSGDLQLPSIMASDRSPRLPAILPQPEPLAYLAPSPGGEKPQRYGGAAMGSDAVPRLEPRPVGGLGLGSCFGTGMGMGSGSDSGTGRLPSPAPAPWPSAHGPAHVDLGRLQAIYDARRHGFWAAVADDYGAAHVSPAALEHAWRSGACCAPLHGGGSNLGGMGSFGGGSINSSSNSSYPTTPVDSPLHDRRATPAYGAAGYDKTSIASLLGVSMEPRIR